MGVGAAGAALLTGCGGRGTESGTAAVEAPPETSRLRVSKSPSLCAAPWFVAEDLLRAEGFTEVSYVETVDAVGYARLLAAGEIDIGQNFSATEIVDVDAGAPIVFLAGLHSGCFELFGTEHVRAVRDLKGKTIAVRELGGAQHVFAASVAAYIGLDPRKDITWLTLLPPEAKQHLADGTVDAYLGFPPDPQELRAKQVGHVVVNSTLDRPWSQYFCCMAIGNREFVNKHPVATKRALRALLKAVDICAAEPERAAQLMVDGGRTPRYDYALQTIQEVPYNKWREYDPQDTLRFYALRLKEAGMIKSTPQQIISKGARWRYFNELKRELKA